MLLESFWLEKAVKRMRRQIRRHVERKTKTLGRSPKVSELGTVQLASVADRVWIALFSALFGVAAWSMRDWMPFVAVLTAIPALYCAYRGAVGHRLNLTEYFAGQAHGDDAGLKPDTKVDTQTLEAKCSEIAGDQTFTFLLIEITMQFMIIIAEILAAVLAMIAGLLAALCGG